MFEDIEDSQDDLDRSGGVLFVKREISRAARPGVSESMERRHRIVATGQALGYNDH